MRDPATSAPGLIVHPIVRGLWPGLRERRWMPFLLRHIAIALAIWLAAFAYLGHRPAFRAADLRGAYADEGGPRPFRWTGTLVTAPIYGGGGPTVVDITLGGVPRDGQDRQLVALATDMEPLTTIGIPNGVRRYRVLLPAGARELRLSTAAYKPPPPDPRWLGVQLFEIRATPSGLPLRAARDGLLLALALAPLSLLIEWGWRRGVVEVVVLAALALGLRLFALDRLPPGFFADEVVSAVDAWHIANTARDHFGHLLPLGAFEAFGDWISPLLTYLELPLVAALGPGPLPGRLTTALIGGLTVVAGYGLARALRLPRSAAALTALVITLSPWQIFLSRVAIPPALVPLSVTLCLWAGVRLIQRGDRAAALALAAAGGLTLYAYPTLKLLIPLLVALAVALALRRHGWAALRRWWPGAILIVLIWLPFVSTTLFNPAGNMRLSRKALQAETAVAWLAAAGANYSTYFSPAFYYIVGDPGRMLPEAVQLPLEAPLVLLGLGALLWLSVARGGESTRASQTPQREVWWLLAGATLLAPLPASLTSPNPHLSRGATVAPIYALLVGLGGWVLWGLAAHLGDTVWWRRVRAALAVALTAGLIWQGGQWFAGYLRAYPRLLTDSFEDGLFEACQRAVALAPQFDEIWINSAMIRAPLYLLAAEPMPPAAAQAQTVARHAVNRFTLISRVGQFRFDTSLDDVPPDLPALETVLNQIGSTGYVLQPWEENGKRVLIVRRIAR